ncbi:hypothetical protein [Nostoc sp. MG11]|nr:hypothetical protein [Nostoc sp. MG11]
MEATMDDPKLRQIIAEINLFYQEQEQLIPIDIEGEAISLLLNNHL